MTVIVQLCVSASKLMAHGERHITTGYLKEPVNTVHVRFHGLDGDEQVFREHGGPDRALLSYALENYAVWQTDFGIALPEYAAFGENLTTDTLTEDDACIGDIYQVGTATIQVAQPRRPCVKIAARHGIPKMNLTVMHNGMTGILYRVIEEGTISRGDSLTLVHREGHGWTVKATHFVLTDHSDLDGARRLLEIDSLAAVKRSDLTGRLQKADARALMPTGRAAQAARSWTPASESLPSQPSGR